MDSFFTDLWQAPFLRYAVLTSLAASVAFGVTGTLVVVRRITSLAGAIAHAVLGGVGAALFLQRVCHWQWCLPIYGAIASAVLAAVIIGAVNLYAGEREDTVIGVIWALGMAAGLLFLAKTPGYVDLQGYLFGNILLLSRGDVITTLVLDLAVLAPVALFYHNMIALSFDDCFACLRGIRVRTLYFLMLILTALTIVLMVNVVGIILVIALLTLPAATAGCYVRSIGGMMTLGALLSFVFSFGGLAASYCLDLPSGAMIVAVAAAGYLASLAVVKIRRRRG